MILDYYFRASKSNEGSQEDSTAKTEESEEDEDKKAEELLQKLALLGSD